ncbi:MAG: HAD family phosphatase [Candidatus Moranbacteria bacterium]|nr:HAD family phosphatase [Candidatus Moranbacteria bacterium]
MKEKNKVAVFDIDGTIFRKNLHFELINELAWMKIFPHKVRDQLVDLYTDWLEHKGTYETYRQALVDLYSRYIKGCRKLDVEEASRIVVPFHENRTYIFAENLISQLKNKNYHIIAVSGSPLEVVEEYNRRHLNFGAVFGSVYEIDKQGRYTGRVVFEPTRNKGQVIKQYIFENNFGWQDSYGIGDTESDVSFLEMVEHPIAFNPNHNLTKIAKEKKWRIVVEKKDVIYEINSSDNIK